MLRVSTARAICICYSILISSVESKFYFSPTDSSVSPSSKSSSSVSSICSSYSSSLIRSSSSCSSSSSSSPISYKSNWLNLVLGLCFLALRMAATHLPASSMMSDSSLFSSSSGLSSPFSPPKLNWLLMLTMSIASLILGYFLFV